MTVGPTFAVSLPDIDDSVKVEHAIVRTPFLNFQEKWMFGTLGCGRHIDSSKVAAKASYLLKQEEDVAWSLDHFM